MLFTKLTCSVGHAFWLDQVPVSSALKLLKKLRKPEVGIPVMLIAFAPSTVAVETKFW